jgi:uncharacterized protein
MAKFIGRSAEMLKLRGLAKKKSASFVVIRGRRRIGKSRLIQEFSEQMPSYLFSGLPVTPATTKQSQLDTFAGEMATRFGMPRFQVSDWGELFWHLGQQTSKGKVLLALDEISWIGSKDPDFLGHLKNAWDLYFSRNPKLILIVCGSVSSWIERNILSSTGFVGRISLDMHLEELPLKDAVDFWGDQKRNVSPYEIFKVLSVTGGVPRYLEEILPHLTAEENIQRLCFDKDGLLFREFDQIFSDLFSKRADTYIKIVEALGQGALTLGEIASQLGLEKGGGLSSYIHDLVEAGFVAEDPTWNLSSMKISNLKKVRLSDNYLRFYVRYIKPHRPRILKGAYTPAGWSGVMGLQFENLVLNNVKSLLQVMGVDPTDVLHWGPFFQRATKRLQGCQVDLLIQTRHRTLYLCEIKFSGEKIGMGAVHQLEEKRRRLQVPRGWSTRLALIHVNGVTQDVVESGLDHVIDYATLFQT